MEMFKPTTKMINCTMSLKCLKSLPSNPNLSQPIYFQNLPQELSGDKIRLKQILINLLKYTVKFSQNSQITISTAYDYSQKLLFVQIENHGIGISH